MDETNWLVYILVCKDRSFYTGITKNVEMRLKAHNSGKSSRYTRSRLPVRLMATKEGLTRSQALRLEYKVKQQKKSSKIRFLGEGSGI